MLKFAAGLMALVPFVLFSATTASADMNATGSYEIDISCKGYDISGKYSYKAETQFLNITQTATDLNVLLQNAPCNGLMMFDPDHPDDKAAASFVSCTINNDLDYSGLNYNILGDIAFSAKDGAIKVKGSYKTAAATPSGFIYSCKFKGERTGTGDPLVAGCAP